MNSQLNPNAAVFIPVSPTKLLMMDDAIISASPGVEFEESSMNLEYSSGPQHVDYFMRDNFSTIPNKITTVTDSTRNSQEHMEHISIDKLLAIQKDIDGNLGKPNFVGITNISIDNESESKNVSEANNTSTPGLVGHTVSEDNTLSGTTTSLQVEVSCFTISEDSHINHETENKLRVYDLTTDKEMCPDIISSKDEPLKGLTSQRKKSKSSRNRYKKRTKKVESNVVENSEGFITEHRRSPPIDLTFKPIQTFSDANPFGALQTPTITTPTDQYYNLAELYKTPQETPKKDEAMFTPEIKQLDIITNTPPSFILRRSPVDDSVVPFEELESPNELPPFMHPPNANRIVSSMELPKSLEFEDRSEIMTYKILENCEAKTDADNKSDLIEMELDLNTDIANAEKQETSFITENTQVIKALSNIDLDTTERFLRPEYTIRQQKKEGEQTSKSDIDLQSDHKRIPHDYSDIYNTLTSKAGEQTIPAIININTDDPCGFDIVSSFNSERSEPGTVVEDKRNVNEIKLDLFDEDNNLEMQETSFTNENTHVNKELIDVEAQKPGTNDISSKTILTEVNEVPTNHGKIDSDIKEETKEMRLELEAHIPTSQTTPEELRNLVQGFEVINKDELVQENYLPTELLKAVDKSEASLQIEVEKEEVVNVGSDVNETLISILKIDDVFTATESTSIVKNVFAEDDQTSNSDFLNAIDQFNETEDVKLGVSEHFLFSEGPLETGIETTDCSRVEKKGYNKSDLGDIVSEVINPLQNPASVVENKQLVEQEGIPSPPPLPPFPIFMGKKSPLDTEYGQFDLTQSMIVAETLATSPEEVNRVPLIEMTEVPLIAGTVPTTLIPSEMKGKELQDLPEMNISITATEEEARDTIAEEEVEKEEDPVEKKKPVDGATDRFSDNLTKQPAKPEEATSAAKPAAAKTTTSLTKPASGVKTTTSSTTTGKTPIVKSTSSSMTSKKPVASGSGSVKPTTTTATTSKPNTSGVAATKPPASSTVPSKPAASSTVPSKPTAPSASPSKSTTSSVIPSKSSVSIVAPSKSSSTISSKTSTTSMTPSKPAASSGAPSKPAASSGTPSKSAASSGTPSKSAASSGAPSKPVASSGAPLKPVAPSLAPSKPVAASKSAAASKPAASKMIPPKLAVSSSITAKPVVPGTNPVKPVANSPTAAKPTATTTPEKHPAVASIVKPVTKPTTPSLTKSTVTSTTSSKPAPKQLPISETTPVLKSPSKPSSLISNPTTPTSPSSPMVKSTTIKSPPKSETKSPLPAKSSTFSKPVIEKSSDKRPATNSDVKSLIKKAEPKSSTSVATKPSALTKPSTSGAKAVGSATKSQTPTPNKTAVAKPTAATATKQKPVGASDETSNVSGPAGAKKSATPTVAKIADKNSKEPASGKTAVNGKTTMTKTSSNAKTDPKGNTKIGEKPVPSKKPEEGKKEEKSDQVQEHKVSTSNDITNDQQSLAQPLIHIVAEAVN